MWCVRLCCCSTESVISFQRELFLAPLVDPFTPGINMRGVPILNVCTLFCLQTYLCSLQPKRLRQGLRGQKALKFTWAAPSKMNETFFPEVLTYVTCFVKLLYHTIAVPLHGTTTTKSLYLCLYHPVVGRGRKSSGSCALFEINSTTMRNHANLNLYVNYT